jgi:hypothetical protein
MKKKVDMLRKLKHELDIAACRQYKKHAHISMQAHVSL